MNQPPKSGSHGQAGHPLSDGPFWLLLGSVVIGFAGVRLAGMFGDLWLDEIWSLGLVERIGSAREIFTELRHDNNHPLNSLWLYLLPASVPDWCYRGLAWLTGGLAVVLAGLIGRRQFQWLHPAAAVGQGNAAGLLTAVLMGGSYLMIHYASEARGYAPVVCGSLLAFYALLRSAPGRSGGWAVLYGGACMVGLLAHPVAFQVMCGGLAWTTLQNFRAGETWRGHLLHGLGWHALPWLFFAAYYTLFLRQMEIGGGPDNPLSMVLGDLAAYTLGLPASSGLAVALPVMVIAGSVALILIWRQQGRALVAFYALAVVMAPALALACSGFTLVFPRYFILSAAGLLLLLGYTLTRLWGRGGWWRGVTLVVLTGFLVGNGLHVMRLVQHGRGQYQAALRYVADLTPTVVILVSSDHDFRNAAVMDYYRTSVGVDRELRYFTADQLPPGGVQWVFLHRLAGEKPPGDMIAAGTSNRYRLDRTFRHGALSGWDWFVYRREIP